VAFDKNGGYDFLEQMEKLYSCAGFCSVPLFYLFRDIKEGMVEEECLVAMLESFGHGSALPIGWVIMVIGVVLVFAMVGACSLCSGGHQTGELDGKVHDHVTELPQDSYEDTR